MAMRTRTATLPRATRHGGVRQVLAVIGAGASGTLATAHLLRAARGSWRVVLIDRERHGTGAAYSTRDPRHLLNVPAAGMSAFDDDPGDFVRWCRGQGRIVRESDYLPRQLYGAYLRDLLTRFAAPGDLELVRNEAVAITRGGERRALSVALCDGRRIDADAAIVAVGNPRPAPLACVGSGVRVVADPWNSGSLERVRGARRVLVVGAGLTAVDIAQSVTAACSTTEVLAISRHGRLPQSHLPVDSESVAPPLAVDRRPIRLRSLVSAVSEAVRAQPTEWRNVVDSLRPHTPALWQALSLEDQRKFLRELKWMWDIHRHRMAPQVATETDYLRARGRLRVQRGTVASICGSPNTVTVSVDDDAGGREFTADWVVNATGPAGDITGCADLLVRQLLDGGLAQPDDLGIGFACTADGALLDNAGAADGRLFTLGPPRRGELLESTAIPEIRAQAATLSHVLTGQRSAVQVPPALATA